MKLFSFRTNRIALWSRALLRRPAVEQEMDREMRFHLEMEIEKNVREGMPPDEARRRAMIAFGGVQRHKESVRDEFGTRWIGEFWADLTLAARSFRQRPGFTVTAVLTMAIGIGAATAVFSLANWVLLRPIPGVRAANELASIGFYEKPTSPIGISYPTLTDLIAATPEFSGIAAMMISQAQFAAPGVMAKQLSSEIVAGDYFGTLGVSPAAGRLFTKEELTTPSITPSLIISDRLWQSEFGRSPAALGTAVRLNGTNIRIIGVAGREFLGTSRAGNTDLWLTIAAISVIRHDLPPILTHRDFTIFNSCFGRLRSDATPASAELALRLVYARIGLAHPEVAAWIKQSPPHVGTGIGTAEFMRPSIERSLRFLAIIAAIVLLVSCANAANLLLFRGVRRRGEMAVRRSLGASGARLLRLHVAEGLLLGVVGGAAGMGVAFALFGVLRHQRMGRFPAVEDLTVDGRVLLFAVLLSLVTGALFAVVPAIFALKTDFLVSLKDSARSDAGRGAARLRRSLIVLQIAASMVLVVTGLLFARTLTALYSVDTGLDVEHTTVFYANSQLQGYSPQQRAQFTSGVVRELKRHRGIDAVATSTFAPYGGIRSLATVEPVGEEESSSRAFDLESRSVSADYFATLRIPVMEGTGFLSVGGPADSLNKQDVVVSRAAATKLFGAADPIGKVFQEGGSKTPTLRRIIGVTADERSLGPRDEPNQVMYTLAGSQAARGYTQGIFLVRSSLPPADAARIIREAVAVIDPAVPVSSSYLLKEGIDRTLATERLFASLVSTLAALTLLLMAIGLYGVMAYSVAERIREIGIRSALGASATALVKMIAGQSLILVAAGIAAGTLASLALSKYVASYLFGVTPLQISNYLVAAIILIALGAVAVIAPARTAASVAPADALRHN